MNEQTILDKACEILEKRAMYNTRKDTFSNPESVHRYLKIHFAAIDDGAEHFTVLYLDNRHRLISAETPFHGTIDQASVYPREILKQAIANNAAAVILAHNHPSGIPTPSDSDIRLTKKLKEVLDLVQIRVLDHIICGCPSQSPASLASMNLV